MFTKSNKDIACGIWSTTYIIAFLITFSCIIVGLILSRKFNERQVKKTILGISIFATATEIIKMLFYGFVYGIEEVEFVPLYFCSLFIYMTIIANFNNKILKDTALSFLFFGGIIGAFAFFMYPTACIPNYPIYHFLCIRTMMYHGLMIYTGLLIVITGYYKPDIKHFWNYFIALLIICIGAYVANIILDKDFMYIMNPLDVKLSKDIYNLCPNVYPFIVMILEILVPFWISFGVYKIVLKIKELIKGDK